MTSKQKKIETFDPNAPGQTDQNIYGLPFTLKESEIVILPVPWDVTTSFKRGTALSPEQVLEASSQVDLHDMDFPDAWKRGIFMKSPGKSWIKANINLGKKSGKIIRKIEKGIDIGKDVKLSKLLKEINDKSGQLNKWVYSQTTGLLNENKKVGILGGEHSVPLGFYKAVGEHFGEFSILQIDAHADLRSGYEGFKFSHASIMYNALKENNLKRLIQIGIRDICDEEVETINASKGRVKCFFDRDIKSQLYKGISWETVCKDIIRELSGKVVVSFDIDGLDPKLCPNTGTPVPGGFQFEEISYLFSKLAKSRKKVVGFDLCEIGPDKWDANVGARVLYKLCGLIS